MNDIADLEFDVLELGLDGKLEAIPKLERNTPLSLKTLPFGLPPVQPSLAEQLEEKFLQPHSLPIHSLDDSQKFFGRTLDPSSLYTVDVTPVQTTIVVDRNPTTAQVLGYKEEFLPDTSSTVKNSLSLRRPPGPPEQSLRGSSTNYPFWPGGLEEPNFEKLSETNNPEEIDFKNGLVTCPPGFASGIMFEDAKPAASTTKPEDEEKEEVITEMKTAVPGILSFSDILGDGDEIDMGMGEGQEEKDEQNEEPTGDVPDVSGENIDDLINEGKKDETIKLVDTTVLPKEEWAVMVDVKTPVTDFHKRIPSMAKEWPFEPDVFQKQAILHLEQNNCVFVAAHTSAGKTVVAEYAIALSLKHMTRTVYTSPIKALSNQKFRDFKTTFKDVGLITGDVQINQEASCLIMTTEILRSMLYNGSEVIRDLEWVIFDEVHYINDSERGVVWEEVLIMLPQHVNIILLSATVPNTMEFADWVGRTKKKKVYVVSTQKRPVPLEHYLYTGNSAKTSNELFLLMDAKKNFLTAGYNQAFNAKKEREGKGSGYGPKAARGAGGFQQDKNIWLSVIEMLRKKDKLPIVAFTFSKKKIDENVQLLQSVDLTTQSEKSEIHLFFQKCVSRLKPPDRALPQVKELQELLKRGIGKHHSGVLPILKEVVEMLFGKGLVKVLFATETFAMGVNMPARTVVFDSIRKHDGTCFRNLMPGEYIQMAGRAGRRGLDTTGTVILLCKGDIPEMADLHKMMLGKPIHLQSQFRLTYTMILNLLRVEQLRVEDMMKKSFSEFHSQKEEGHFKERLKDVAEKVECLPEVMDYSGDLEDYYYNCVEYWRLKDSIQDTVMHNPQSIKALSPGRVVIVDNENHRYTLGVILQVVSGSKERLFKVLVICQQNKMEEEQAPVEEDTTMPRAYVQRQLFKPKGACSQALIEMTAKDIAVVTNKSIKVNPDKIIDDIKKRQMPRFRHDPVGQSTSVATQELLRLTEANPKGLPGLDPVKDLGIKDIDMIEQVQRLQHLEGSFDQFSCIKSPSFQDNFKQLKSNMALKEEFHQLKYRLSDESLQLLPEYQQRINVLRKLQYIDASNTVQLKGRVACEISQHELIITELVFQNALTKLHPFDIAAVLSCVVFEQKRCSEPNLTPELKEAKEQFLNVARRIGELQRECGLKIAVEDYVDSFNFGLMEVVFEWARGMEFSEITQLTDVQEGIIVRCIQRLDEVLKDGRNAARIIGEPVLHSKMEEASAAIKRDIVFAASLYTQ